jgi:predicted DsbA family dithiol-disulfide isomerase
MRWPQLVSVLFRYYFAEGRNVGDAAVLAAAAAEAGLDAAAVRALLTSDAGRSEVVAATRRARTRQISGVPHYVFGEDYALTGGQSVAVFSQVLTALARQATRTHHL